jgi:hypothetical protein
VGFRALENAEALEALRRITSRLRIVAKADHASSAAERSYVDRIASFGVPNRIDITEITGRCSSIN